MNITRRSLFSVFGIFTGILSAKSLSITPLCNKFNGTFQCYVPTKQQQIFHDSTNLFKSLRLPVGGGKTCALCYEALTLSYANHGCYGLIAASDYGTLFGSVIPSFLSVLCSEDIPFAYTPELGARNACIELTECKSTIIFDYSNSADNLRSKNFAWFGMDEAAHFNPQIYPLLQMRLRDKRARRLCGFRVDTA